VEVLEAAQGAPFLILGGQRLPIRGLPLPHPLADIDAVAFPEGDEIDVGGLRPPEPEISSPTSAGPPLPNFLIIGAQKSATRWLRSNLDAHPDIFTAPGEPGFFNDERRLKQGGVAWYRAQFEGWSGEPFVGESTPGYLMWTEGPDEIATRIHRLLPDVRLLAVLRNPVDRARSAMMHHVIKGRLPADADLLTLVERTPPHQDQLGLISGGWYAASLAPYVELFGDQLLVLLHDDVVAEPAAAYARAVGHIGAAPHEAPVGVARVRESQESLLPNVRRLTRADREQLHEYFRDDIAQLATLLDRDLSAWDPAAAGDDDEADASGDEAEAETAAPADATASTADA
jgi:Sulfotransferase family